MSIRSRLAAWALRGVHPRDPALAEWFGMLNMTAAGVSVTAETAMRVSAVYACIRVLSETVASLPLVVYRRKAGGGKERAPDHWLYPLLHSGPNGWMTSFAWREQGVAHQCLRGVAYSRIVGDARGRRQLVPIHPDRMRAKLLDTGRLAYELQKQNGGTEILLQEEVLRIPHLVVDGIRPVTPIEAQKEALGAALAAQDYSARFWANDAKPRSGWIEMQGNFKSDDDEEGFRKKWQAYMTGENRHKVAFLPKGMIYHALSMTMEDAQFLETRKLQRSEVASIFRVPPHMIGDLERATFSNVEQQSIDFVVHTIRPWLVRWEQELSRGLLSEAEQEKYFVEFLVDGLLRGDANARANYFRTAVLTGWMNRNEVREIENMNRETGLDEFLAPLNMTPADLLADVLKGKTA